jgi:hypothetical protein
MGDITKTSVAPELLDADATPKTLSQDVNWERAFKALVVVTCTGFINSQDVEKWVQFVRKAAGDRPAEFMIKVFNQTRPQWMHDLMG